MIVYVQTSHRSPPGASAPVRQAHDAWLRSMGIDPAAPTRKRKGTPARMADITGPRTGRDPVTVPTSDAIPAPAGKRRVHAVTSACLIAQPYHKGPLMVVQSDADLVGSRRRG